MITGHTRVYAVIGRPVAHSGSPALHNLWFVRHGIDAVYVALDVPPERGGGTLAAALRTLGLAGANLTIPHKTAIVPHLDDLDDAARAIGAANTVVRDGDRLRGFNTDAAGFTTSFEAESGRSLSGARALVLGAGGAGRAVAFGVARAGAARVWLANRTLDVAERAAAPLGDAVRAVPLADASRLLPDVDVVVNALSGPGADAARHLDVDRLPPDATWADLNYWMPDPPARDACRKTGRLFLDGGGMLRAQAALAFEHFTGVWPEPLPE
jgi:shikimate dehydrogenase